VFAGFGSFVAGGPEHPSALLAKVFRTAGGRDP
jgi:hypothetical protein